MAYSPSAEGGMDSSLYAVLMYCRVKLSLSTRPSASRTLEKAPSAPTTKSHATVAFFWSGPSPMVKTHVREALSKLPNFALRRNSEKSVPFYIKVSAYHICYVSSL